MTPQESRDSFWAQGDLRFLLRPYQSKVREFVWGSPDTHTVAALHRGFGKSYLACVLALEKALSCPGSHVLYLCSTTKNVRRIVLPILETVLRTCPIAIRPEWKSQDAALVFPNGSRVWFAGGDLGNADDIRGVGMHFTVVDEEAFLTNAEYLIQSVVLPRSLLVGGKMLHISTPATSPSHPFCRRMETSREAGSLFTLPVTENPDISPEVLASLKHELGANTSAYRRECLCIVETDENYAVIPELLQGKALHYSEDAFEHSLQFIAGKINPAGLSTVVSLESSSVGLRVRDELILPKTTLEQIAKQSISRFGTKLFMVADTSHAVQVELCRAGLPVVPQNAKEVTEAGVSKLRTLVANGKLFVSPDCKTVTRHLHHGVWTDKLQKLDFDDSGDGGKYDSLQAIAGAMALVSTAPSVPDWQKQAGWARISGA